MPSVLIRIPITISSSTALSSGYPSQQTVRPLTARATASSSPSPRILITVVSRATAIAPIPTVMGSTGHAVAVPAANATASVRIPFNLLFPAAASATASIVAPTITIVVTSIATATANIANPIPVITITSIAQATANVVAPEVHHAGTVTTPPASATASVITPIIINTSTSQELAFPEDPTDQLWAGNLKSYDDTMSHT